MPELPEVETIRLGLEPIFIGQKVRDVVVRARKLRWQIPSNLSSLIKNHKILALYRRGKYLLFVFDNGGTLIIHLGMTGRLLVLPPKHKPDKHEHLVLEFANNKSLCFIDPRKFGAVLWTHDDPLQHPLLQKLGKEPFDREFTGDYLWHKSRQRKVAIKQFLMDGHTVAGVGNIYANEALFAASVRPDRMTDSLTLEECKKLTNAIKQVLRLAIKKGGTTIRDYVASDGSIGSFVAHLSVYAREGQRCIKCGAILKAKRLGQRSTVYCAQCQK